MRSLPEGWKLVRLADVAETALGKMLDRGKPKGLPQVPYLRNKNVQWGHIHMEDVYTMEVADDERDRFAVESGDLLVCEGGEIGRAAIWRGGSEYLAYQKAVHRVRSRHDLHLPYLGYILELYSGDGTLSRFSTGSTIAHLPQQRLRELPIPLPPAHEQRRIVDILEAHLSRLDAAVEDCNRAIKGCLALRIALLSKALFARTDWPRVSLSEALDLHVGGLWGAEPDVEEVNIRVLRVTELGRDGELNPSTAAVRSVSQRQLISRQLAPGDLLLEKSGGGPNTPVGRVGLVDKLEGHWICSNFMHLMRPRRTDVVPRFLHLYLNALYLRGGTVPMQAASTNIRNIKVSNYVRMLVPLPSPAAQETAVAALEADLAASDRLLADLRQGRTSSTVLRRALLEAAFSGRLTARSSEVDVAEETAGV